MTSTQQTTHQAAAGKSNHPAGAETRSGGNWDKTAAHNMHPVAAEPTGASAASRISADRNRRATALLIGLGDHLHTVG